MRGLAGVHVTHGPRDGFGEWLTKASPTVVFAVDQDVYDEVKTADSRNVVIFRHRPLGMDGPTIGTPAANWWALVWPVYQANRADLYGLTNELDPPFDALISPMAALPNPLTGERVRALPLRPLENFGTAEEFEQNANWYRTFNLDSIALANGHGVKLCLYNWSYGTPSDDGGYTAEERYATQIDVFRAAQAGGHCIGFHEYGPTGLACDAGPSFVTRYRRFLTWCSQNGLDDLRIAITEFGQYGGYGFHGVAEMMQDVRWYTDEIRHDEQVMGHCYWTLGDWNGANCQDGLPEYGAWAEQNPAPSDDPVTPPEVPSDYFDMLDYVRGRVGLTHVLQYDFDGQSGTQAIQTQLGAGEEFYCVKDRQWEMMYAGGDTSGEYICRAIDTSEAANKFYCMYTGGFVGAPWIPRFWKPGGEFARVAECWHYDKATGVCIGGGPVTDTMRFVAHHQEWLRPFPLPPIHDVIELVWMNGGERYFYGRGYGLVGWKGDSGESYICEVYDDRPPQEREAIPDGPWFGPLYMAGDVVPPVTPPIPPEPPDPIDPVPPFVPEPVEPGPVTPYPVQPGQDVRPVTGIEFVNLRSEPGFADDAVSIPIGDRVGTLIESARVVETVFDDFGAQWARVDLGAVWVSVNHVEIVK